MDYSVKFTFSLLYAGVFYGTVVMVNASPIFARVDLKNEFSNHEHTLYVWTYSVYIHDTCSTYFYRIYVLRIVWHCGTYQNPSTRSLKYMLLLYGSSTVVVLMLTCVYVFVGPSYTIDTACSSSLLALDHALLALRTDQCDSAIVGGSSLCIKPSTAAQFNSLTMLSPDGSCKSFDESGMILWFQPNWIQPCTKYSSSMPIKNSFMIVPCNNDMWLDAETSIWLLLRVYRFSLTAAPAFCAKTWLINQQTIHFRVKLTLGITWYLCTLMQQEEFSQ